MTLQHRLACCQLFDSERIRLEYDAQYEFDKLTGEFPYDPEKIAEAADQLVDKEKPWRRWRLREEVKKKNDSHAWSGYDLGKYLMHLSQPGSFRCSVVDGLSQWRAEEQNDSRDSINI